LFDKINKRDKMFWINIIGLPDDLGDLVDERKTSVIEMLNDLDEVCEGLDEVTKKASSAIMDAQDKIDKINKTKYEKSNDKFEQQEGLYKELEKSEKDVACAHLDRGKVLLSNLVSKLNREKETIVNFVEYVESKDGSYKI
jgi:uncharacterized protein (DUF2344 family)